MVSDEDDNDCVITGSENTEYMDDTDQTQGYYDGIQQGEEIGSGSWPPCIRVIVTDSDCLDPGSLYIVTCDGAQIGREKDQGNTIIIPDLNVSKVHASISYQCDLQQYVITDHGSQNGTFLDETRISESKIESRAEKLSHGSTLQFSCTRFLLHIHNGTETCDECEPGQVQATMSKPAQKEAYTFLSKKEKIKQQRQNLKQIKKKYGLQNAPYVDNVAAIKNPTYQDKAEERRRTKGSDNPYIPDEAPASVNKPIAETNVGHKLLKKMGWSEGKSLGKDNEGIQQPGTMHEYLISTKCHDNLKSGYRKEAENV
ncbi:hypothetical protein FSP39_011486 [Pinctada imbricata]|uniref:Angiogenic factor with G patch and FHA domains 1 n=1 Tax=Pinctada imbricata TaxID=66713 RepID=A0AA88YE42_PINIB|nr:hypothetical protein FSP39_011486 [Pinctada imbricata]